MSVEVERGNGLVPVAYHQFKISDEDGPIAPDLEYEHNGLVEVEDGVALVHTGIHTGDVDVTVAMYETAPASSTENWQEILEFSAHSVSGELMVRGLMADPDEELPVLSFNGPGDYRLRVHARGRDTAVDLVPEELTEWYLIQAWPAPPTPVTVLRQSDNYGASLRAS
ncbi:hypothetical protein ABZX38_32130 [Streptomyces longwoodensis]|uniref:hypothetical protein n=1 Tax=Streptomyces longwoodensis TaxID=68231 RepID=UPI00339FA91F